MCKSRICRLTSISVVRLSAALAPLGCTAIAAAQSPVGTGFTYQGRLMESGSPADGSYDFRIELWNAPSGGTELGHLEIANCPVSDGLFTISLNAGGEFGPNAFNGEARWLRINVRPVGGSWQSLEPRQPLSATPYALTAAKVPGLDGHSLDAADGSPVDALVVGNAGTVGIGSNALLAYQLNVASTEFDAIRGRAIHGSNPTIGVTGETHSTSDASAGVWGVSYSGSGGGRGVFGQSDSPSGYGGYFLGRGYFSDNVGIGADQPERALHVAESSGIAIGRDTFAGGFTGLRMTLSEESNGYAAIQSIRASGSQWGDLVLNLGGGNVGVGIAAPVGKLDVNGTLRVRQGAYPQASVRLHHSGSDRFSIGTSLNDPMKLEFVAVQTGKEFVFDGQNGFFGIGVESPTAALHVRGASLYSARFEGSSPIGTWVDIENTASGGKRWNLISTASGNSEGAGALIFRQNENGATRMMLAADGNVTIAPGATTRVSVLEIMGADLAEKFPVSEKVEPGMVVAIDAANPGELCLARGAYDRRVAGVVSGANNFSVGAVLGNLPGHEDAPPIALSGRVYVWCDASCGAIEPGDLLTTAETPGHAMRVSDPARAQGAIIGKAMTNLERGRGLVLVLVSLQ